jgi:hypothetical protein
VSGLAHITLPYPVHNDSRDEAWISGGPDGLIFATDTFGTGHITSNPLDQPVIFTETAFASLSDLPSHDVINTGPCRYARADTQIVEVQ